MADFSSSSPPPSLAQARRDVKLMVKASGTSFAAGMRALPPERREAMYALYAFCRIVDDIADDSPNDAVRDAGLALWRKRIRTLFHEGRAEESVGVALQPALKAYALVEDDFQAIIDGMAMDAQAPIVAPPLDVLDAYCDRVASAVGRASVRIFGDGGAAAMRVAHHLGRALQLTNILRDLAEDAKRGRLYLPREFLTAHGIQEPYTPTTVLAHPNLPEICRALASLAQTHFKDADQAMAESQATAMRPARLMRDYYHALLIALLKDGWEDPYTRVSLSFWQKLQVVFFPAFLTHASSSGNGTGS